MFTFEYHNALFTLVYLNQRALIIVNVLWENYIAYIKEICNNLEYIYLEYIHLECIFAIVHYCKNIHLMSPSLNMCSIANS